MIRSRPCVDWRRLDPMAVGGVEIGVYSVPCLAMRSLARPRPAFSLSLSNPRRLGGLSWLVLVGSSVMACAPVQDPAGRSSRARGGDDPVSATPPRPAAPPQPADVTAVAPAEPADSKPSPPAMQADSMPPTTAFATKLYHEISRAPGNLAFSPFSISAALAMTYAGATDETQAEFERTVWEGLPASTVHDAYGRALKTLTRGEDAPVTLRVANRLFAQRGFPLAAPYVALTRTTYGAPVGSLDFAAHAEPARREINEWVADQTQRRIEELLAAGSVHAATRVVLVNALYFKGDWAAPFDAKKTKTAPFTTGAGKAVSVAMMHDERKAAWYRDETVAVLELPYAGDSVVMNIALPREGRSLAAVEASLSAANIKAWTSGLSPVRVDLQLPRFRLDPGQSTPLRAPLERMGLRRAFDPQRAQFGGITPSEPLWIDDVIHQTFIEVNEEGTEAAAATAVTMRVYAMVETHPFHVNRPFLFMIRDKSSDQILFLGRVDDPSPR
ncbi:MAG: serpin family protein [Myxococcales bacterium FL481]|nr:MAG: serpin family protein [Myxococcales bacterium FL481]